MGEAGRYAQRRACGQAAAPRLERRCPQQVDSADLCPGGAAAPCTPLASLHAPGATCSRGAPRPAGPLHHVLLQRSATAPGPRWQHGGGSMAVAAWRRQHGGGTGRGPPPVPKPIALRHPPPSGTDPASGRTYWFKEATNESQWTPP